MPKKIIEWYKNESIMPKAVWGDSVNFEETGAGPDGIVQPNMPISMRQATDGPPVMLHEGEATIQKPDGTTQVVPQKELVDIEKSGKQRGMCKGGSYRPMKEGGTYRPMANGGLYSPIGQNSNISDWLSSNDLGGTVPIGSAPTDPVNNLSGSNSSNDNASNYGVGVGTMPTDPGQVSFNNSTDYFSSGRYNQPIIKPIGFLGNDNPETPPNNGTGNLNQYNPRDYYDIPGIEDRVKNMPIAETVGSNQYGVPITTQNTPDRIADKWSIVDQRNPEKQVVPQSPSVNAPTFEPINANIAPTIEPINIGPEKQVVPQSPEVTAPTIEPINVEPEKQVAPQSPEVTAPDLPEVPSTLEQGEQAALETLLSYITGDNAAYENLWNRSLQQFGGQAAAQGAAMRSRMAQAGYSPYEIQTAMMGYYRDVGGQTADLMGNLASQAQQIQSEATNKMLGYGLDIKAHERALKGLELSEKKYEDQKEYEEFLNSIEYGDDATVAQAYQDYFGRPITDTAMINDLRTYARSKRQQEIAQGELVLESLRNRIGSENIDYVQSMVNAGYGIDRINSNLESRGMDPLSPTEFKDIYESTPLGERNWNREMTGVQVLLKEGGLANLENAAAMLNSLVPGLDVDFTRLLNENNAEDFAAGLEGLTFYANQFEDWETAKEAMEKDGTFSMLGFDANDPVVESMYKQLKVNIVDEEWETMEDSKFYQSLGSDDRTMIQEMYTAKYTGELEWDFAEEYNLVGENEEVVRTVTGLSTAQAAVAGDPSLKIQETGNINVVPRGLLSDVDSGDRGTKSAIGSKEQQSARGKAGENVGSYYFYGGEMYEKSEGIDATKDQKVVYEPGNVDPFGAIGQSILDAGNEVNGKENPYYNDVIKDRVDQIVAGDYQLDAKDDVLTDDLYNALINDDRIADGYGTKDKTSAGSTGNEIWYYSKIDELNEGDLFKKDGVLYKLKEKVVTSDSEQFGSRHTKYRLVNLKTGDIIEKVAKP